MAVLTLFACGMSVEDVVRRVKARVPTAEVPYVDVFVRSEKKIEREVKMAVGSGGGLASAEAGPTECCDKSMSGGYYVASALEKNTTLGNCSSAEGLALAQVWLAEIEDGRPKDTRVFSRLCVPGVCNEQLLEPLAFNLQDPRLRCPGLAAKGWKESFEATTGQHYFLSKAFLAPSMFQRAGNEDVRVLLFDLGASFYNGTNVDVPLEKRSKLDGFGASGKWFVDEFQKRGQPISHLYLWESNTNEASYRAAGLPPAYTDKITFYHTEIKSEGDSPQNALRVLQDKCRPHDYCVLKVDFDEEKVEDAIVQALIRNDGGVLDLVDEFFWDPVDHDRTIMKKTLVQFRESGVRAHAWV
jgi:hypothetical protein